MWTADICELKHFREYYKYWLYAHQGRKVYHSLFYI